MSLADGGDPLRVGTAAIKVYDEDGFGAGGDGLLNQRVVQLQRMNVWLYQHGLQPILGDGQNAGNVGVGWHNDLVAGVHHSEFDISTIDEGERIKSVCHADAVACSDVVGIVGLKVADGFAQ